MKKDEFLGILGGMGPEAGVEFARILIEKTSVQRDQDHLPFLLLNWPRIPDRTAYLLGEGPDPVPFIKEGIRILKGAGATHIAIPCNTAHAFMERIGAPEDVKLYDMLQVALEWTEKKHPSVERVGVLATKGTLISGIYRRYFGKYSLILPSEEEQEVVHRVIYSLAKVGKMAEASLEFLKVADSLRKRGAQAVILGCTEIETALRKVRFALPFVKPMEALAERIVCDFKVRCK